MGWSQEELAEKLGIAKTSLARVETLEGGLRAEQLSRIVRLYNDVGVTFEFMLDNQVTLKVNQKALELAYARLKDEALRRSDRKSGKNLKSDAQQQVGLSQDVKI